MFSTALFFPLCGAVLGDRHRYHEYAEMSAIKFTMEAGRNKMNNASARYNASLPRNDIIDHTLSDIMH